MDTINNMAKAAATAVWGENKTGTTEEPVSGQLGDTSKGEPYDKGNEELTKDTPDSKAESKLESKPRSEPQSESAAFAKSTGTAAQSKDVADNPSTELKSKDTPIDSTKGQNDTRDPTEPNTNPKNVPTDVDDTGDGINKAQELDGPGPKPLEEVAKQKGGDAGHSSSNAGKPDEEGEPGLSGPSKGEGTGEKYVKSSGLVADGGDFDATKPGAGKEADRLLEQKGIHHEKPSDKPAADLTESKSAGSDDKEKKSLKDKIKDKLHRH